MRYFRLTLTLLLLVYAFSASADVFVIGDSRSVLNSAPCNNTEGFTCSTWPTIAFNGQATVRAAGGMATYHVIDQCWPDGLCWIFDNEPIFGDGVLDGGPDDTWYIDLGTNDYNYHVNNFGSPPTYAEYFNNLVQIIQMTGSNDVRLITSAYVYTPGSGPAQDYLDVQAQADQDICTLFSNVTCITDLRYYPGNPDGGLDPTIDFTGDNVHYNQDGHDQVAAQVVPEAGMSMLMLSGLITLGFINRHKKS